MAALLNRLGSHLRKGDATPAKFRWQLIRRNIVRKGGAP